MTNLIKVPIPSIQEVTSIEALQSGISSIKKLDDRQQKIVADFLSAHSAVNAKARQTAAALPVASATITPVNLLKPIQVMAGEQLSSIEQSQAVAQSGKIASQAPKAKQSLNRGLYKLMFTPEDTDELFLNRDLNSMRRSLITNDQTLVDRSSDPRGPAAALRRFLLLAILKSEGRLEKAEIPPADRLRAKILQEHGPFIEHALSEFASSKQVAVSPLTLKERITAYHHTEGKTIEPLGLNTLIGLYRRLRAGASDASFVAKVRSRLDELEMLLNRERSSSPSKAIPVRHHILHTEVQQLRMIIKIFSLHRKFLSQATKFGLNGLPQVFDLMESTLKILMSSDLVMGIQDLMKLGNTLQASRSFAKNAFLTNYIRWVLKNPLFENYYVNKAQNLTIADSLQKLVVPGAVYSFKPK